MVRSRTKWLQAAIFIKINIQSVILSGVEVSVRERASRAETEAQPARGCDDGISFGITIAYHKQTYILIRFGF